MSEQQKAIDLALKGKSFFLTGAAGTGKTFTLKAIVRALKNAGKVVGVTASTALAASHFEASMEACTLHKMTGYQYDGNVKGRGLHNINVLIIDEISMIADTLLDSIDASARRILRPDLPMGGIQVIGCGDFHQLAPVKADYCFLSKNWRMIFPNVVSLKEVYRQGNMEFINILNKIRIGETDKVKEFIDSNCKRTDSPDLIYLYAQNNLVNQKNERMLRLMDQPIRTYVAKDSNQYKNKWIPQNQRAPEIVQLCIGCPVVITRNVDDELYNGLRGKVVGFTTSNARTSSARNNGSYPKVDFNGKIFTVWPIKFIPDNNMDCYREQIPLALNWAMTIHKAQGITLDGCNIDLNGATQMGQVYVALSRVKDPRQLFVTNFSESAVRFSPIVRAYYESLEPYKLLPGETVNPFSGNIFALVPYACSGKLDPISLFGNSENGSNDVNAENEMEQATSVDFPSIETGFDMEENMVWDQIADEGVEEYTTTQVADRGDAELTLSPNESRNLIESRKASSSRSVDRRSESSVNRISQFSYSKSDAGSENSSLIRNLQTGLRNPQIKPSKVSSSVNRYSESQSPNLPANSQLRPRNSSSRPVDRGTKSQNSNPVEKMQPSREASSSRSADRGTESRFNAINNLQLKSSNGLSSSSVPRSAKSTSSNIIENLQSKSNKALPSSNVDENTESVKADVIRTLKSASKVRQVESRKASSLTKRYSESQSSNLPANSQLQSRNSSSRPVDRDTESIRSNQNKNSQLKLENVSSSAHMVESASSNAVRNSQATSKIAPSSSAKDKGTYLTRPSTKDHMKPRNTQMPLQNALSSRSLDVSQSKTLSSNSIQIGSSSSSPEDTGVDSDLEFQEYLRLDVRRNRQGKLYKVTSPSEHTVANPIRSNLIGNLQAQSRDALSSKAPNKSSNSRTSTKNHMEPKNTQIPRNSSSSKSVDPGQSKTSNSSGGQSRSKKRTFSSSEDSGGDLEIKELTRLDPIKDSQRKPIQLLPSNNRDADSTRPRANRDVQMESTDTQTSLINGDPLLLRTMANEFIREEAYRKWLRQSREFKYPDSVSSSCDTSSESTDLEVIKVVKVQRIRKRSSTRPHTVSESGVNAARNSARSSHNPGRLQIHTKDSSSRLSHSGAASSSSNTVREPYKASSSTVDERSELGRFNARRNLDMNNLLKSGKVQKAKLVDSDSEIEEIYGFLNSRTASGLATDVLSKTSQTSKPDIPSKAPQASTNLIKQISLTPLNAKDTDSESDDAASFLSASDGMETSSDEKELNIAMDSEVKSNKRIRFGLDSEDEISDAAADKSDSNLDYVRRGDPHQLSIYNEQGERESATNVNHGILAPVQTLAPVKTLMDSVTNFWFSKEQSDSEN